MVLGGIGEESAERRTRGSLEKRLAGHGVGVGVGVAIRLGLNENASSYELGPGVDLSWWW